MCRNSPRVVGVHIVVCVAILLGIPTPAPALPLISELFYDAVGTDNGLVFVAISGAPGAGVTGLTIEGINGSGGGVTVSIARSGVIPADGLLVLADDQGDGATLVPNADLIGNFDFQNG